jgi:outer membrane receptor protein involved in Fe transport
MLRRVLLVFWVLLMLYVLDVPERLFAQDASTGAIRGAVQDTSGARIPSAQVIITEQSTGIRRGTMTNSDGVFTARMLPPGTYAIAVKAEAMNELHTTDVVVELGSEADLKLTMRVAGTPETVTVADTSAPVAVQSGEANAEVIDERSIQELPLNGRRFSDLALLVPGVVADPRGMTSSSNGDLSSGGIRGFQSSFLVDGADNNNGFFAQARGRYRAPYQFSNESVQEFRVNTNSYGAELGRAGAAVINVVTKSGSNQFHGKTFYFLRDSAFNAQHPYTDVKTEDQQHQFGATLGGPLKKNRAFFFASYDQHIFRVPTVVRFGTGAATIVPQPEDYEASDRDLVMVAASALNKMTGNYQSRLIGNAGFAKVDVVLSPTNLLSARINTSTYYGDNNVFFDPASPITHYAITENGEENVRTMTGMVSLTSGFTRSITNNLRVQFSRDWQESTPNSPWARTQITGIIEGFGRSLILPRQTHEGKFHLTESLSLDTRRNTWKVGGDMLLARLYNYFPLQFGGDYIFRNIRVDPFTFAPATYGMELTALRAYAHVAPRYYLQNFGTSESHPDTNEYALFAQDSIRVTRNLGLTLGVRYDLQTFRSDRLQSNPLWPDSGKVPTDTNNVAPRFGFSYSMWDEHPLVIRGGYGLFYTRIPSIYTSAIETENGINRTHLFLDNMDFYDRQVFPKYPNAIVTCDPSAKSCEAPASVAGNLTSEVSSFSPDFQTPFVQQTSLSVEKELVDRFYLRASYLFVHGEHLIRARDVNLPAPVRVSYPVFDETGTNFLGSYYVVDSFSQWETNRSLSCPFPPCMGELNRPITQLGAINVFESATTSIYHGFTVALKRSMTNGLYFRVAYTWGQAMDDGQDALVVGRPATVQNSYSPNSERGWSSVDQRQRWVAAWTYQPKFFHRDQPMLRALLNNWRFNGVMTFGTGRPINAQIVGDANNDGNTSNDRLPGYSRNAFLGPNYSTTDFRFGRKFRLSNYLALELMAEAYNVFNRDNQRVDITDDGFGNSAANFAQYDSVIDARHYPAQYRTLNGFLVPTNAYAPRQLQFALRLYY